MTPETSTAGSLRRRSAPSAVPSTQRRRVSLSGCKTALFRGHLVLRTLAEVAEPCRQEANRRPFAPARPSILLARAGENINPTPRLGETARLLTPGSQWTMRVDLGRQLQVPREVDSQRPDFLMWSEPRKSIGGSWWEEGMEPGGRVQGGWLEDHRVEGPWGFLSGSMGSTAP